MKTIFNNNTILKSILVLGFVVFVFGVPQKTFAACQLVAGQFRNFDYGSASVANWFSQSFLQNEEQPYLYLDLKFNNDCIGQNISFSIGEHDTLDPNDTVLGPFTFNPQLSANTLERTHIFRAGDEYCDGGNSPDCWYFFNLEIDGEEYDYSTSTILSSMYDCHGDCDDQTWQYLGSVYAETTAGYEYGSYWLTNDPDFISANANSESGGQGDEDVQDGGQGDDVQTGGQGDGFQPLVITEQIENPLGDGSSLPAFVESLLGIIVRAGIPLIVLALVYTGFRFVEARGNPGKIEDAKKLLLWTVIGSAIILGAWTIATILTNTITTIIS